jgi:hypothetical protein
MTSHRRERREDGFNGAPARSASANPSTNQVMKSAASKQSVCSYGNYRPIDAPWIIYVERTARPRLGNPEDAFQATQNTARGVFATALEFADKLI